jgi:hypothetical protein
VGAGAGITVNNDTVALSTSGVTAGTYGQESTKTLTYNDTFTVPVVTVDTYGRVTSANEYTLTMPGTDEFDNYIPLTGSSNVSGDITSSAKITATEFVGPATQLKTGRTLKVNLARTSASTAFDGTANITNIGVSGTLAVGNGGTGQTSAINAANAFLNALTTGDSVPSDNDYFISQYVNGGTTHTTFHRRPVKHLYSYIKGKTDTVYVKLTGSSNITGDLKTSGSVEATDGFKGDLNGNAATATALTSSAGAINNPIYFADGKPAATIWTVGNKDYGEHNCNNVTYNFSGYYTSNGPATSLGATTNDGSLWAQAYSDIWVTQIAQDYRDGALFVRGKNNGTWKPWLAVLDSSNFHDFLKDTYVNVAGDTMTGDLQMGSNVIHSKYYKITDGSTDKATYQYNSADDCIELVFA